MAEVDQTKIQEEPQAEGLAPAADDEQKPLYNKVQMADVVKREKEKAFERGKRHMMEELQQQQQQAQPAPQPIPQPVQQPQSLGGMPQLSQDDVMRMIAERTPQLLQQQREQDHAHNMANGFVQKMRAAEARHPGLESKLNELDYTHLGPVIKLVDSMDNPADIMKELVDNPMKMGNLVTLAHTQPNMAKKAMFDLSNSIKQNQTALAQEAQASEPLGQITPSNVGSDSGSKGSVRDFKNRYRG